MSTLGLARWFAVAVLFVGSSPARADTSKAFELRDGSAVVGVVIDEGDTGYIVRKRDGTTMKIPYSDVVSVSVHEVSEPGDTRVSSGGDEVASRTVDGLMFPNVRAALEYQRKDVVIEYQDTRSGLWSTSARTSGRTTGTMWDGTSVLSSSVSALTGVDTHLPVLAGVKHTTTATSESSEYRETISRQYRLSTGDGIILIEFNGDETRDPSVFFNYIGRPEEGRTHTTWVGSPDEDIRAWKKKNQASLIVTLGGAALMGSSFAWLALDAEGGYRTIPLGVQASLGVGGFITGLAIAPPRPMPTPRREVLAPWGIRELVPYVYQYNEQLAQSLQ